MGLVRKLDDCHSARWCQRTPYELAVPSEALTQLLRVRSCRQVLHDEGIFSPRAISACHRPALCQARPCLLKGLNTNALLLQPVFRLLQDGRLRQGSRYGRVLRILPEQITLLDAQLRCCCIDRGVCRYVEQVPGMLEVRLDLLPLLGSPPPVRRAAGRRHGLCGHRPGARGGDPQQTALERLQVELAQGADGALGEREGHVAEAPRLQRVLVLADVDGGHLTERVEVGVQLLLGGSVRQIRDEESSSSLKFIMVRVGIIAGWVVWHLGYGVSLISQSGRHGGCSWFAGWMIRKHIRVSCLNRRGLLSNARAPHFLTPNLLLATASLAGAAVPGSRPHHLTRGLAILTA
mmetsp:Transcript_81074/g.229602  ORF Transcript_81074/g.229602 Transcript_81074/m.229602 type:complete len:349 (-) Transcript_81074:199-1245(-)